MQWTITAGGQRRESTIRDEVMIVMRRGLIMVLDCKGTLSSRSSIQPPETGSCNMLNQVT